MANIQTFSPDQARSVAGSIKNKGNNAKTLFDQLGKEINAVEGWWQGDSSRAFIEEFNELKPSLDKLVDIVDKISQNLNKIADIKEQSERDIASQLRK